MHTIQTKGLIVSWRRLDPMHAAGWSVSDDLCVQRETNKKAQIVKANWANPTAGLSISDSSVGQFGCDYFACAYFTVSNIIKMDGVQDEKSSTSENVPCNQSSVQSCSISEERSILLSQAAIMDVVENLRTSNKQDGVQNLTARQTWPNISGFQVGRRFKSFLEFEQAFDAWKSEHFHTFRVASSETLRLKDGAIDPIFRYRYIVYHCAHYGVPRVRGMFRHRKYNYLPCGCSAMLRLNYSWSERTLRITTLHEKHTGHAVSAQAYKEFLEKSKRFGSRQNPANETRRFSAPLPSTALTNCHTLEALLNPNDSPLSDKENDPATVKSAAEDSVVIEDGVETNEEKVELSSSPRTDEERFQIIHAVLQGLCDNLLESEDAQLDEKLAQLAALHSQWREMNL
ncbi:RecBCD enzyme subunit RecB [Trichinella spiralis]|uniref:RecBCD enzyme subunit RecB n=1 Tax=Trichinella spiralis TaxID=6334 RepID=A0ABR3KF31_TRISP